MKGPADIVLLFVSTYYAVNPGKTILCVIKLNSNEPSEKISDLVVKGLLFKTSGST
jgi:hypothetical protein